jgi:hypothetical protein
VSFDKFGWLKALQSDPRYTDKEQRFGSIICVQFARRDGTGWTVNLDDIGAKMATGIDPNRMKIAFRKFVRDGYLQETGKSRGGRGVKAWRSFNLTKPYPVQVRVSDKTLSSTGQNPIQKVTKPYPEGDTKTWPDLREDPPKGTSKGTSEGTGARATDEPNVPATPEPPQKIPGEQPKPPDPYCADHMPDGTTDPCGPCGTARTNLNAWRARGDKAIRDCGLCDDRGGYGLRAGPFITCPHDKKRIDELEAYHQARESA